METISKQKMLDAGYIEYERDKFQKKFTDAYGTRYFINVMRYCFRDCLQDEWWEFEMQIDTPKGAVEIRTVQWFNHNGESSGNTIMDVEVYMDKMWVANDCPYYERY